MSQSHFPELTTVGLITTWADAEVYKKTKAGALSKDKRYDSDGNQLF